MKTLSLVLVLSPLVLPLAPQKRTKQPEPADFPALIAEAQSAWEGARYGACVARLQDAIALATRKRTEVIRAALPAAPQGWKLQPVKDGQDAGQNAFAAAMAASVGNVIQADYAAESGGGRIDLTLTADSPLVQMFQVWVANPALLDKNSELIEYEGHKAVLRKDGKRVELQVLLLGKHVLEVKTSALDDDGLLRFVSQEAVDRLSKALAE